MTELKNDDIKKFLSDDNYYIIYFGNVYKIRDRDITYMGNIEQLVDKKDATKIQIGDLVKCISDNKYVLVRCGGIYKVRDINEDGNIQLVGVSSCSDYWYDANDFAPVEAGENEVKMETPVYSAEIAYFGDILYNGNEKIIGVVVSTCNYTFDVLWLNHDFTTKFDSYNAIDNTVCVGNIEELIKKSGISPEISKNF